MIGKSLRRKYLAKKQLGFSLVELMIAMGLGTFIIAGVISVFLSTSQNYSMQQAIAEVQSKGNYLIRKMRQEIQLGGLRLPDTEFAVRQVSGGLNQCSLDGSIEILEVYRDSLAGVASGTIKRRSCYFLNPVTNQLQHNLVEGTGALTLVMNPANLVTLASNVAAISFGFAVDLRSDTDDEINLIGSGANSKIYLAKADLKDLALSSVDTEPTWQGTKAVKVEIIVGSDINSVVQSAQVIDGITMPDRRLYKKFTAVIALRNRVK